MFLHLSVSHSVHKGGLCPMHHRSHDQGCLCPWGVSVWGCLCPGWVSVRETPQTETPRTVVRGRYASYWNAFFFPFINNLHKWVITLFMLDPHVESTDRSTNYLYLDSTRGLSEFTSSHRFRMHFACASSSWSIYFQAKEGNLDKFYHVRCLSGI